MHQFKVQKANKIVAGGDGMQVVMLGQADAAEWRQVLIHAEGRAFVAKFQSAAGESNAYEEVWASSQGGQLSLSVFCKELTVSVELQDSSAPDTTVTVVAPAVPAPLPMQNVLRRSQPDDGAGAYVPLDISQYGRVNRLAVALTDYSLLPQLVIELKGDAGGSLGKWSGAQIPAGGIPVADAQEIQFSTLGPLLGTIHATFDLA